MAGLGHGERTLALVAFGHGSRFAVIVGRDRDGWYVATAPALFGCHTQARSLDELRQRVEEAIRLCLEVKGSPPEELEFVGVHLVRVPA